jgi:hypothetical protein
VEPPDPPPDPLLELVLPPELELLLELDPPLELELLLELVLPLELDVPPGLNGVMLPQPASGAIPHMRARNSPGAQ